MTVFLAAAPSQSDEELCQQVTTTNWAPGLVPHFDHRPCGSQIVVEISPYEMGHTISSSSLYFSRPVWPVGFLRSCDIVWV